MQIQRLTPFKQHGTLLNNSILNTIHESTG
jgi:hypothetical protein